MWTGFAGNADWADAAAPSASIAATTAAVQNHLPMASSRYPLLRLSHTGTATSIVAQRRSRNGRGMLTIPLIASSSSLSTGRPMRNDGPRRSGERDGGFGATDDV